jgi:CRISPR-associated protein Cas8c/Csd1 subtype I-C
MIIQRLYELAKRENLLDEISFEKQPVPFVVQCDAEGNYLGILDRRGRTEIPAKGKQKEPKIEYDNGKELPCPRAHGNKANAGFACYFVDTVPRVVPYHFPPKSDKPKDVKDAEDGMRKGDASRLTFWRQVEEASRLCTHKSLETLVKLGRQLRDKPEITAQLKADFENLNPAPPAGSRCALACVTDTGLTLTEIPEVKVWYRGFLESLNAAKEESMPKGICQVTGKIAPIPSSHSFQFKKVRGGLGTGTYLVSMDKQAFQSYGLDGTGNTHIGLEASQSYALALQALVDESLPGTGKTSLMIGDNHFLFWTREAVDLSFMGLLDNPDTDGVASLLQGAQTGKTTRSVQGNDFYLLVLSANSARLVVRDYLEAPLDQIQKRLAKWFEDLSITVLHPGRDDGRHYALWMLAAATAGLKEVGPLVPDRMVMAALRGDPLPESILNGCLGRLKAEGAEGCTRQRLSLVKLFLVRKGVPVTESLNCDERHPAYLYGRLLQVFDEIQQAALGEVNAGVVDKFYTTFSSAPALIFSRLYANAQNHLRKLRNEKPGAFVNLDRKLTEVSALLPAEKPKGLLSLRDQGLFALGFYHQRAETNHERAARKAAKQNQGNDENE